MRTSASIVNLSDEQLVTQFGMFHYKWLRSTDSDVGFFDYVEELRKEILKRMAN